MSEEMHCPECGGDWSDGQTCTDHFHLMGFWELDHQLYELHPLMVLCYHLQHPSLYSPNGLNDAMQLLIQFVVEGASPQAVRRQVGKAADSSVRKHKILGTPQSHGEYPHPVQWTMTAADVTAEGMDNYYANVRTWAQSVLHSLRESANLAQPQR